MTQSMTRVRRTGAVTLLIAASFGVGVSNGATEPSASPQSSQWPAGSELRTSLAPLGYSFRFGDLGSPWPGEDHWTGGRPDLPGSFARPPERSVRLDGADDMPVTARLLVGDDTRLIEFLDLGTAVGVPTSLLLEVSDLVRESVGPAQVSTCAFAEWPVAGGRIVLWQGGTGEAGDLEVAYEPQHDAQPAGPGVGTSSSLEDGIPASAEEACRSVGDGATAGVSPTPMPTPIGTAPVTVVTVEAREFTFSPAALTIPASGVSRIVVTDAGGIVHNFTVDALGIQVVVPPGDSGEVMIVDPDLGTYQYYCSISGHKEAGMVGTLTVE